MPDDLWNAAQQQYPILSQQGLSYAYQPALANGSKPPGKLEFYSPTETDRPAALPLGKPGVAVFDPQTRPIDILADWASHSGRETDPKLKTQYEEFVKSMTPQQQQQLQRQYIYARNEGETRSFEDWAKTSGIPAWYRGYLFGQWPKEFTSRFYTPDQIQKFNEIKKYLGVQ